MNDLLMLHSGADMLKGITGMGKQWIAMGDMFLMTENHPHFQHIENRAARVKAAMRTNAVMVASVGDADARETFYLDMVATFDGDTAAADEFLATAIASHNWRHGAYDTVENPWVGMGKLILQTS